MHPLGRLLLGAANARGGAVLALSAPFALPAVGPARAFMVALGVPGALAWLLAAGAVAIRFAVGVGLIVRDFLPALAGVPAAQEPGGGTLPRNHLALAAAA